jgi:hypothetical protein
MKTISQKSSCLDIYSLNLIYETKYIDNTESVIDGKIKNVENEKVGLSLLVRKK